VYTPNMSKSYRPNKQTLTKEQPEKGQMQKARFVTINANHEGQRIDNFLLREIKDAPRSYM